MLYVLNKWEHLKIIGGTCWKFHQIWQKRPNLTLNRSNLTCFWFKGRYKRLVCEEKSPHPSIREKLLGSCHLYLSHLSPIQSYFKTVTVFRGEMLLHRLQKSCFISGREFCRKMVLWGEHFEELIKECTAKQCFRSSALKSESQLLHTWNLMPKHFACTFSNPCIRQLCTSCKPKYCKVE